MNTEATFNMDALLDGTLDDLADLPSIAAWPAGGYKAVLDISQKVVNKHPCFELSMTCKEVLEIPADKIPPAAGDKTSILYMMDNEIGQGKFKNLLVEVAKGLNLTGKSNREIVEAIKGLEVAVGLSCKADKKGTERNDILQLLVA